MPCLPSRTRLVRAALGGALLLAVRGIAGAGGLSIVDPLIVGVWSPFGTRWEADSRVCVQGEAAFRVIATTASPGGAFALDDGAGNEVAYRVFWKRGDARGRGEELASGEPSRRVIAGDARAGCGGDPNAHVRVRVNRRAIDRAPAGIYRDTLMLTLSPL